MALEEHRKMGCAKGQAQYATGMLSRTVFFACGLFALVQGEVCANAKPTITTASYTLTVDLTANQSCDATPITITVPEKQYIKITSISLTSTDGQPSTTSCVEISATVFNQTINVNSNSAGFVSANNIRMVPRIGNQIATFKVAGTFYNITPTSSSTINVAKGKSSQVCQFNGLNTTVCYVNGTEVVSIQTNQFSDERHGQSLVVYSVTGITGQPKACFIYGSTVPVNIQAPATLVYLQTNDDKDLIAVATAKSDADQFETRVLYCSDNAQSEDLCNRTAPIQIYKSTKTKAVMVFTKDTTHMLDGIDFSQSGTVHLYALGLPVLPETFLYSYRQNSGRAYPQLFYGHLHTFIIEPDHEIALSLHDRSDYLMYAQPTRKGFYSTLGYPENYPNPNTDEYFASPYVLRMDIVNGTVHNGTTVTLRSWNNEEDTETDVIRMVDKFEAGSVTGRAFLVSMIVTDDAKQPQGGVIRFEFADTLDKWAGPETTTKSSSNFGIIASFITLTAIAFA